MGYDVHITRAEDWQNAATQPIVLDEWLAYVRSDPEMRLDDRAEAQTASGKLTDEHSVGAVWTAYSNDGAGDRQPRFFLRHGCISVKSPDAEILLKMSLIALHFRARVQGDDGEDYYGPDGMPVED